jgi:hypothetical protein
MNKSTTQGIDRSGLPNSFLSDERRKSSLILEANLLKAQGAFEAAAAKFASAAEIEEQLSAQLMTLNRPEKAFTHQFSALSCWAQAGNLYRAMTLGESLLQSESLAEPQRQQVNQYLQILHSRFANWMRQWSLEGAAAD